MRTTITDLKVLTKRLLIAMEIYKEEQVNFMIDNAPCYGGWRIELQNSENGGVSLPFTNCRLKAKDMAVALQFAENAICFYKMRNNELLNKKGEINDKI